MANTPETEVQGFDDAPRKAFKLPKWSIITLAIIVVLAVIALIVPSFLDQSKYKDMIIGKVEESTGYKVSWAGNLGIAILPTPHVTINEATVSNGTQQIVMVKKAEISVELMPLLDKKVQISSIKLTEPDINLTVDQTGRQTWMTEKLNQQKNKPAETTASSSDASKNQISFDSVKIEKGHIVYKDNSKGSVQDISNLDLDLSAKSLSGPFDLKASLNYNGNDINVDGNVGEIADNKPTSIDLNVTLPKLDVEGSYKGEITLGAAQSVKGDLKLSAKDLEKTISALSKSESKLPDALQGNLNLTSAIVYDGDLAALDNMDLAIGKLAYKGNVSVMGLKTATSPKLTIDIASTAKNKGLSDALTKILSDLSVKGSGTFINNVATIDKGVIGFEGQTINLSGTYALPGKANAKAIVNATIAASKIDLDDLNEQLSPATESAAQKAVNEKSNVVAASSPVKGLALPFDGNIKGNIGSLNFGGKTYSNVNFDLAANGNALTINNFALGTVADTTVVAKGTIADTTKLAGLDVNANVKTGNVEGLAKAYNVPLNLTQTLGAASVNGNFKGSLEKLGFNAAVDALGFAVTGVGSVQSVTSKPVIETLNLTVRHPSLQTAVRNFSPNFEAPGNFNGALDLSTSIALNGKQYDLSNIKGQLGGVTIAGTMSADMSRDKPSITGNMNFGNMVFDSPAPKAGTTPASGKASSAPASSGETRWSREAIDTAWMNKFNADLKINAASITQGLWKLANANLAFRLTDGSLAISNMDANLFGGNVAISGNLKGGSAKSPLSMDWTAKAKTINAQQLLSAVQNKQADTVSGTINNFDLTIASSGASPAALVYALSGRGSAGGKNLVVKGVDAAKLADAAKGSYKPLERAGSLYGSFQDGQTAFTDFNTAFTIQNGIINFSEIKFDGAQAMLTSTGNINLPRWTIDLKNSMTVKNSDIPAFDFAIAGPLDNPLQAGGSVIENYLRNKAQAKIEKLIGNKLTDKLGLPAGILGGNATTTPTATTQPATTTPTDGTAATAPLTKEQKKQEQIQQGVKALQGLFGK